MLAVLMILSVRLIRESGQATPAVFLTFILSLWLLTDLYWVVYDLMRHGSRMPFAANEIGEAAIFLLEGAMLASLAGGWKGGACVQGILALLFAACLAVPLLHMELPSDPETLSGGSFSSQTQETENRVRESILRETQDYTAQALRQALANAGITCSELDVQVHIDESDCIHISKVTATCDDFAGANALLSDLLGGEGEIVVTQILRETQRP